MRCSKRLLAKKVSFFLAPMLALPLVFFGKEYRCLYVIVVMCVYWVTKCIPMGITSLIPLLLFPFFEIMPANDVSPTYFLDTTVLGIASLLMSNAVEEVMLHKRIALGMIKFVGYRKQLLLLGTVAVTGLVSMCVADMAACVMMLPIVLAILKTLHDVREQSLSVASLSSSDEKSSESFELEERMEEGGSKKAVTTTDCRPTGREVAAEHGLDTSTWSKFDRGFAKALVMSCATSSLFGGKGTLTGSTPNIVFREQFGPVETVSYLQWASFSMPFMLLGLICNYCILALVFMVPTACWGDSTNRRTPEEKKRLKEITNKKIKEEYDALGRFSFAEGSVLAWFLILILAWMSRNPGFAPGWGDLLADKKTVTDGTTAMLVIIIMFIWPKDPFNDETLEPILTWKVMKTTFSWSCVLLVAAGNAISAGVKASGLSKMIGCFLKGVFGGLKPFWLQVLAQLSASLVSEFTSNTSTAGVFVPIMISLANAFHLNPLYLVLPSVFASSWGFMMPMATPANAVVYDSGILSIVDMCIAGFFLKIAAIALTALNFETLAYKLLKLDEPLPYQTANVTLMGCP